MGLFKHALLNRRRTAAASVLAASAGAMLLAAAPLRATAAQADAQNAVTLGGDVPTMVVRYQDLNLATDGGARVLLERIRFAADAVCPAADNRDLPKVTAHSRCVRQAIARAVQQVGNPRLAAVYSMRGQHG